jgi:membrane-associated phospholipid phosphatase
MHWLQTLDTALFHFINRSMGNPLFDWLMPILSGANGAKGCFILIAAIAAILVLCFGNARARLCALMIFLVVAIGDPLIINTIKHAVGRPRPCVALADVVERLGCSDSGSMPSAHAANWFAMTMIAFLFYRRSLWFMLPMALGVSFSRIYNGVHYPSDVLAGAILGAGYAIAIAVTLENAWQFFGRKYFPFWHTQLPSLLNPKFEKSEIRNPKSEIEWFRLGYILIFILLISRWIYLASGAIELSGDEAYQWIWSKHLALSYYSKPLGIALIQFLGTHIFGDTQFGVRFFSPLFAAILSVMMFRFLARETGAKTSFWLLLIATATPLLGVGAILMTIDPPLVLCWMWALVAGWRAAQPDGKTRDWLVVGLAMGLGFLCKYTAAYQIICFTIFFALRPAARIHLRKPGPWLALLIFLICTTPVVIWNSQHNWITIHHVAGNAGLNSNWQPTLRYFQDFLLAEFTLLNPFFFIGAICAAFGFWRLRRENPLWLFFFCMSVPVLLGHLLWSFHSRIQPNWIAPAVPPLFCLMAVFWDEKIRAGSKIAIPFLAASLALGIFSVVLMYDTNLIGKILGQTLPGEKDPSHRVRGWKQTAETVEAAREKLETEGKPAFIIASHYGISGLFTFYSPPARAALKTQPLVYCIDSDAPQNQFYFWPQYDYRANRKGQNAIYAEDLNPYPLEHGWIWKWLAHQQVNVLIPPPTQLPARIAQEFESVTDLGEQEIKISGRVLHREHLWACYNLK